MNAHERCGVVLCWAASKRPEWKSAILERIEAVCPGETVTDDGGRLETQPGWRKSLVDALPRARAILLVIEPRALLRAQIQPPGYDCVDELVPREIQALLAARGTPILPLLTGGAEWPNAKELPPELQPLTKRPAVTVPVVQGQSDFSVIDGRLRELQAAAPAAVASPVAASPATAAPGKSGGTANPFLRSRWRMIWLQHRTLIMAGAALLIAGMMGAAWLVWTTIGPAGREGVVPSRGWRPTTVREALQLPAAELAAGRCVLFGEFRVTAARGDAAVLRPIEAAFARNVRIDARFANESARPADRALFRATAASGLIIGSRRRGADGQWTLTVRAVE